MQLFKSKHKKSVWTNKNKKSVQKPKKMYKSLFANKKHKEYEQKKSIRKQLSLAVTNNKNKNTWHCVWGCLKPPI